MIFGAKPPKIDKRDYKLRAGSSEIKLESFTCGRPSFIKDQGPTQQCVACATAVILEHFNEKETSEKVKLSNDFIYGAQGVFYNQKTSGMYLRDACKIAKKYGDATWYAEPGMTEQPAATDKIAQSIKDNPQLLKEASIFQVDSYAQCDTTNDIKCALMTNGPVLANLRWYDDYSLSSSGSSIEFDTSKPYNYHAIVVYGWTPSGWLCQNSWGKEWGSKGCFILPYKYELLEAWTMIDATNTAEIEIPKTNCFTNFIYKIINFILNAIKKKA